MKTVVIYKSKSGFTKKYAEWIAADLGADLFEAIKVTSRIFASYDTIIYGGGLYAVGINGVKLIKENEEKLKGKKVVVFATGASPARAEALQHVQNSNFLPEEQQWIRFFYLRGGFDQGKLTLMDRMLMTLLKWKIRRKKETERTPDEKGMLAAYDKPVDFTRKKNIDELTAYVRA